MTLREHSENEEDRVKGGLANYKANMTAKSQELAEIGRGIMYWAFRERAVTDQEIEDRVREFFDWHLETGNFPTFEKLALALGYTREVLYAWERGGYGSTEVRQRVIRNAKELLASYEAALATEGRLNPFVYQFRAKNYFGMRDQQEHILTPSAPLGENRSPEEIAKRINLEVPDDDEP
jgi:hypothetical protein